ncbi:hypothetical protein [Microbacterium sp.]|uniref:hypothetical protein n=1 Tax=Microbacterium sp. TaxID=51671 RepID=UPI0039E41BBA
MTVTLDAARAVLAFEGDHNYGTDAGHFANCLIRAIKAADPVNRDKLRAEFPELVAAVEEFRRGGVESLRGLVKSQLDRSAAGLDFGRFAGVSS